MKASELARILRRTRFSQADVSEGAQMHVFTKPRLKFVIKVPKNIAFLDGYGSCASVFGGILAKFTHVEHIFLNYDNGQLPALDALVQEKVRIVHLEPGDKNNFKTVEDIAALEHEGLRRGRIVLDNFFSNMGYADGTLVYHDIGSVVSGYDDTSRPVYSLGGQEYEDTTKSLKIQRGFTLYDRGHEIGHHLVDEELKAAYVEHMGLTFKDIILGYSESDVQEHLDYLIAEMEGLKARFGVFLKELAAESDKAKFSYVTSSQIPELMDFIYNVIVRRKYADEFVRIAEEEAAKYLKNEGQVQSEPYITADSL